jgi:hypothetical protein
VNKAEQQRDLRPQQGAGPREPADELRRLEAVAVRNGSRKAVIRAVERRLQGGVQELRVPVQRVPVQRVNEQAELVQSHETALRAAAVAPSAAVDPLRLGDDRQRAMCVRLGKDLDAATAPPQLVSERRNSVVTRHAAAKSGTRLWRSLFLAFSSLRIPTKVVQVKNTVGAFNLQTCILYFPEGLQAFLVRVH